MLRAPGCCSYCNACAQRRRAFRDLRRRAMSDTSATSSSMSDDSARNGLGLAPRSARNPSSVVAVAGDSTPSLTDSGSPDSGAQPESSPSSSPQRSDDAAVDNLRSDADDVAAVALAELAAAKAAMDLAHAEVAAAKAAVAKAAAAEADARADAAAVKAAAADARADAAAANARTEAASRRECTSCIIF